MNRSPPQRTAELDRIKALPRRPAEYSTEDQATLVREMTAMLRTPSGTMSLRPIQAVALFEIGQCMGGFLPIRVSAGKTIVSLLSATILGARRPLLIVPAALVEATRRRWRELAAHWRIYPMIEIRSYQWLSRVAAADFLDTLAPDAVVLDECHKAKDLGRSVARRLRRYVEANPTTSVVAMTGTVTKRSIKDYAHIVGWALKPSRSPLPNGWNELDSWAYALDPPTRAEIARGEDERPAGALVDLDDSGDARAAYRARLVETMGVVSTRETSIEIPILIERWSPPIPDAVRRAVALMRDTWETPDGTPFTEATALWRHCRELATGFYYRWNPLPPKAWVEARRAWASAAREIHSHGRRGLDTGLQIANAVDDGLYPEATEALRAWRAIEPTFKPRTEPVWLDPFVVDAIADDARTSEPTWYWTEHTAFARALAQATGLPYYGREASTDAGVSILDHPRGSSGILSYEACREGLDLQYVARNVFCFAPTDGARIEQALGRTHRDGQEADEINVRIIVTCEEHTKALDTMIRDATYIQETTGQQQKVLLADWI